MKIRCILLVCLTMFLLATVAHAHSIAEISPTDFTLKPGEDIRLGMSNALSGPASVLGQELKEGAGVYIDKVNAGGGIHGRKLKLISYDDGYEPARTISNTTALLEKENAFMLFGYVGTPTSRVVLPIARRQGVPYVAPFTGAEFLRHPVSRYVLNVRASYYEETENMVNHLVSKMNLHKIGMFIQDDTYGIVGREGVEAALSKRNMKLAAVGEYKRNTKDILPALEKLQADAPEAVIMIGAYGPTAAFIKEARKRHFNPVFMSISFVGTTPFIAAAGTEGEGVYISQVFPSPETSNLPLVQDYRADMAAAGLTSLSYGSLEGYADARALALILQQAGPVLSREGVINAAETLTNADLGGLPLTFNKEDHQGLSNVYLTRITNGHAVPVEE